MHNSARFCPECGNAVSQIPAEPKAIPITKNTVNKVIPVTQNKNSVTQQDIPISPNQNTPVQNSIPVAKNPIPITQRADSSVQQPIPISQKNNLSATASIPVAKNSIPITQNAATVTNSQQKQAVAPKKKVLTQTQNDDSSREQSKAPTDPFDSINKLLGKSGKKVITAIVAVLTAVAVCIGGFYILKDYKGGIGAVLSRVEETKNKENKEESTEEYDDSENNSSSSDNNVVDEPETEPEPETEALPDYYNTSPGAGSYTIADGDTYVIAIGETIDFNLPPQNVGTKYYSISWEVSEQLLKIGGLTNAHNCSGKAVAEGEGYIKAVISWYDAEMTYNSYEITATVFVRGEDSTPPDYIIPDNTNPDNTVPDNPRPDYTRPGVTVPDDENCAYCSGTGTLPCNVCEGTGYVTKIIMDTEKSFPCTHPQCNDGVKDCPYC